MYKIGGRKNANNHYKLSCKWASWFWRKYHGLALPSGPEINVWLLLRRAGILVLLTEWEAESLSPCWWLGCGVVWCSHCLPWTEAGQLAVAPCILCCVSPQLNCAYHICCDTAFWSSHFISPLHCHTLKSCLRWHDTFSIPFSFFCLFPLLLWFVFFFQSRQDKKLFYDVSQHHKNSQMKCSTNQIYQFPHTSVSL